LTLPLPLDAEPPRPLRVRDGYGPIGQGASNARAVLAENGSEYIIKGPSLAPGNAYVAVNEHVAACLAEQLGLPVLDHRILDMNGDLFFAGAWMAQGTFLPHTSEDLFNKCDNKEQVYGLVTLDAWVCNTDRHAGNLLGPLRWADCDRPALPALAQ
jgi:hypothetical protein